MQAYQENASAKNLQTRYASLFSTVLLDCCAQHIGNLTTLMSYGTNEHVLYHDHSIAKITVFSVLILTDEESFLQEIGGIPLHEASTCGIFGTTSHPQKHLEH